MEHAFRVLQSQFATIEINTILEKKHVLHDIMTMCIIMQNMIIEDERDLNTPTEEAVDAPTPTVEMVVDEHTHFQEFLSRHCQIRDKDAHIALRNALIEHLWEEHNNLE